MLRKQAQQIQTRDHVWSHWDLHFLQEAGTVGSGGVMDNVLGTRQAPNYRPWLEQGMHYGILYYISIMLAFFTPILNSIEYTEVSYKIAKCKDYV